MYLNAWFGLFLLDCIDRIWDSGDRKISNKPLQRRKTKQERKKEKRVNEWNKIENDW